MIIILRYLTLLVACTLSFNLFAEDKIILDEGLTILYEKIGRLEQEISELRSKLEESTYAFERFEELNQQRYIDIDRRLYELSTNEKNRIEDSFDNVSDPLVFDYQSIEGSIDDIEYRELLLHKNALELFDLGRYAEALEVFDNQIVDYPSGKYAGDAYFWSGELFLAQEKFADARESYLIVINQFKGHIRYYDAHYKLGEIARIGNELDEAKNYFEIVIKNFPDTGVAELALKSLENIEEDSN